MPLFRLLLFIVSCCFFSAAVVAQETAIDTSCEVKQLGDLFRKKNKEVVKPPKSYYLLVTPVISSSPATGFVIGFASQLTFKGKQPDAKYSLISANAQYTTKNQALFNVKNNVLLANNRL